MIQSTLWGHRPAPLPDRIDYRKTDAATILASVGDNTADLVIADPPWGQYKQDPGRANPANVYHVLSEAEIGQHISECVRVLKFGGRLALWTCWPLLADALSAKSLPPWLCVNELRWVSGGAWTKSGVGVGYHWRGQSEPVLLGVKIGGAAGRPQSLVFSGHASDPQEHSRKPAEWQRQWVDGWVPPGGLVVDPYAGLGSVAEAVALSGANRRYIGAEIDEERHARGTTMVLRALSR